MKRRFAIGACAAVLAAGLLGVAGAAPKPPPSNAPVVQAVVDCRKIDDGAQRLACYDAAVDALAKAQTSGDLVTLDRKQRQAVRRQAFGFTLPTLEMFDRGEGQLQSVEETLASASQDQFGRWIFVMKDGQVWRQIDDQDLEPRPHPGDPIRIQRAMMGSFMLSVGRQAGVRAHRDE